MSNNLDANSAGTKPTNGVVVVCPYCSMLVLSIGQRAIKQSDTSMLVVVFHADETCMRVWNVQLVMQSAPLVQVAERKMVI